MKAGVRKADPSAEFGTAERCWILDTSNDDGDPALSISRARVEPGVTTEWHSLRDVDERYVIVRGRGRMDLEGERSVDVGPDDVVRIPAGTGQRITNTGSDDLVFHCVCTPRFTPECYVRRLDLDGGP